MGVAPDVPLSEIDPEPEEVLVLDEVDPYVTSLPFPHAPPGPAENELFGGMAPDLLPRSQDVDLAASAVNMPLPPQLRAHLKSGLEKSSMFACSKKFVEAVLLLNGFGVGKLLRWSRANFLLVNSSISKGCAVKFPTPALPGCSPMSADRRSIRSVFWYSETDV